MEALGFATMVAAAGAVQVFSARRSVLRLQLRRGETTTPTEFDSSGGGGGGNKGKGKGSGVGGDIFEGDEGKPFFVLDRRAVVVLPLAASAGLLLFHFFPGAVGLALTYASLCASALGVAFLARPVVRTLLPAALLRRRPQALDAIVCAGAGAALLAWMATGSGLVGDVLGAALCVLFIVVAEVQSLRLCAALLAALFVYDVFWVFGSPALFGGQSVMVAAATTAVANPAHAAAAAAVGAEKARRFVVATLQAPVKLVFPGGSMLGLGDIAAPGLLLSFLARFDAVHKTSLAGINSMAAARNARRTLPTTRTPYFVIGMVGYVLGIALSAAAAVLSQSAQPALLYIVPLTLIPPAVAALSRGELYQLWAPRPSLFAPSDILTPPSGGAVAVDIAFDGDSQSSSSSSSSAGASAGRIGPSGSFVLSIISSSPTTDDEEAGSKDC